MSSTWLAPETMTHAHWKTVQAACMKAFTQDGAYRMDWSACKHMDSTALALAIAAQRVCKQTIEHLNPPNELLQLAQLHGVDTLLGLVAV